MSVSQRILTLLHDKHLTKAQLSKAVGIPYTTLDSMLKRDSDGERLLSFYKIAETLGVTMEELVFGEERPLDPALTNAERELLDGFRKLDRRGRGALFSLLHFELSAKDMREKKSRPFRRIPIYDLPAAAGTALPLSGEDFSLSDAQDVPVEANFGIRIAGNSMEPLIQDGSVVWVKRQTTLSDGEIGIFLLNGESLCKRLSLQQKGCALLSENKEYPPLRIHPSDDLRAVGKVLLR